MSPNELLRELEPLPHDDRMRRMVEVGRRAAVDPSVAATLASFEQGGFYERWLALQSCFGSRDGSHVLRALADPSRAIRRRAAGLAALVGDDAQVQAALEKLPLPDRTVLLRRLYQRRRYAPVDAYLETLAGRSDDDLPRSLPFGSSAVVSRHLEQALPAAGLDDWERLARLHPDFAADALQRRAAAAEQLDPRLIWQANAMLPILVETRPDRALDLVRALLRHVSLASLPVQRLAGRRPADVADLLLASGDAARVSFDGVAQRLDLDRLQALIARHGSTLHGWQPWLHRLSPAQRAAIYAAGSRGWRDADGCLPEWLVTLLPHDQREQEGRRHLALPALATRPTQRLPYAAFLPWDDALRTLEPFIRHPDAELRAAALSALVFAARFHRDRLPDLLTLVRARRYEQDPVRRALLVAMANLPPGMWRAAHLDDLGQIIRDALDAADLSAATAGAAERLVGNLLPFHPAWCAGWLATLVRERGQVYFHGLGDRLSDADVRRIAPELLPVLRSWETREREAHLISVAWSLGRRLRVFDGLVEILERVLRETRSAGIADRALALIAEHRRDRLASLVPDLLREDKSWITRPVVYAYLHRRRQDLLTPFLGQQAYRGRFSTGKTRFVLPLTAGFHRWTPAQQAMFAKTLHSIVGDGERDVPAVLRAIDQLAALPAVPPTRLVQLAGADSPKPVVRDAALRALARLDASQGVPTLIEALGDDRARIAIYALRRALLEMPAVQALSYLRAAPLEKVTVAKEVVRLLGDLRTDEAYCDLLALDGRELHRDVRVAVLRALWNHLGQAETWIIFERAAVSPDPALASVVGRIPVDRLSPDAQQRLAGLLATLLGHPDPKARLDALGRCAQLPVIDAEQALLSPLLAALHSPLPDECAAAAAAAFATYTGRDAHLVGQVIARLIDNRRALRTAVHALEGALRWNRRHLLPTARAVLAVLEADPLTATLRVSLAISALQGEELAELLSRLATADGLHADALAAGVQAIEHGAAARSDPAELARLEAKLAAGGDERLRRLALAALIAQARPPHGWDDERLARLRTYRTDPSRLVAAAAQFTLPPVDTETEG
ncbi:MAG: hypothetical protein HY332_14530 [Chloroflexi bacterium]|nr:hypothetical protein [Chloroflexota bacterium]